MVSFTRTFIVLLSSFSMLYTLSIFPVNSLPGVISRSSDKQLPRIDSHALVFENGKNFVVTVDADGKLAVKEVEVYRQLSKECYLSSGVQEGDRILNKNVLLVYNALNAD